MQQLQVRPDGCFVVQWVDTADDSAALSVAGVNGVSPFHHETMPVMNTLLPVPTVVGLHAPDAPVVAMSFSTTDLGFGFAFSSRSERTAIENCAFAGTGQEQQS